MGIGELRHSTRRAFLASSARAGLGASLPLGSLLGLTACREARDSSGASLAAAGYGPLQPTRDEATGEVLLSLPRGFRYRSMGWQGTPLPGGGIMPGAHDGMGIVAARGSVLTLVRNHEVVAETGAIGAAHLHYDAPAAGGCVAFEFDVNSGAASGFRAVLGGTMQNCAGGVTPWGTWLSCEELVFDPSRNRDDAGYTRDRLRKPHGFVFEVDPSGNTAPRCIPGMGAFKHEAVAVHAATGIVYQTEDFSMAAGFYRYVPDVPGRLDQGGRLQMLACAGRQDMRKGLQPGQSFATHWVDIPDPQRLSHSAGRVGGGVFEQGEQAGGAIFSRLEGCFAHGDTVFFTSTNGGDLEHGQVFVYYPREERLVLLYETRSLEALDYPDNLCVSPRGGLVICEDNVRDVSQRLIGMSAAGDTFALAANIVRRADDAGQMQDYRGEEWCGVCFSPDGRWLFANVYRPGFTVAITGPWQHGPL